MTDTNKDKDKVANLRNTSSEGKARHVTPQLPPLIATTVMKIPMTMLEISLRETPTRKKPTIYAAIFSITI